MLRYIYYIIIRAYPDSEMLKTDVLTKMLLLASIILGFVCSTSGNDDFYKREYHSFIL